MERRIVAIVLCLCLMTALPASLAEGTAEAGARALTEALLPGRTLLLSAESGGAELLFTADEIGGWRRLAVAKDGEVVCESGILPSDTLASLDDAGRMWLRLPSGSRCAVADGGDGRWGIGAMELPDGTRVTLGPGHAGKGELGLDDLMWGSHPWEDLASVDWTSFPVSWSMVAMQVDPSGLGVVDSAESGLTVALRKRPDSGSAAVGRYWRGAPFTVLSSSRDWVQVSVGGVTGWLPKDSAAIGYVLQSVQPAYKKMKVWKDAPLYTSADGLIYDTVAEKGTVVLAMGEADGGWYHVLVPSSWRWGYVESLSCISAE